MGLSGLGDRAQLLASQRHNVALRERMAELTQEASTGVAADLTAHLGGDTAPLADVDRRLALAEGYGRAAREAGHQLAAMQVALSQADDLRGKLAGDLVAVTAAGAGLDDDTATSTALSARAAFDDLVGSVNARWGEGSLFGGTEVGGAALAPAEDMMAGIRAAVGGATTAAAIEAALDTWFDDPAGGFATMGYQGSDTDATRGIDQGASITLRARADDPALRDILKAAATAALAADPGVGIAEGRKLLEGSRDALMGLASPLTALRADVGLAEGRVEEAVARHAARETAFGILRAEMTGADPYRTATELEAVRTQLETHYALTARLQGLSLVSVLT